MEHVSGRLASSCSVNLESEHKKDTTRQKITSAKHKHEESIKHRSLRVRNICLVMKTFINNGSRHPKELLVSQKFQSLKHYYRDELFKGVLFALHSNVKTVTPSVYYTAIHTIGRSQVRNEIYIRDPLVFMTCKNKHIALSSEHLRKEIVAIFDAVHAIPSCPEIKIMEIDSCMDGGNVIYSTTKKLLLHGNNLAAQFEDGDPRGTQTTRELEEKMRLFGVCVMGINTNILFYKQAIKSTFFHLDCFMHLLPDDRLLIMNKTLLTHESFERLKHKWGDDLIDLACPLTDINTIPPMNLFSFESEEGIIIISNNVSAPLLQSLVAYGKVITVKSLDSRSPRYDEKLSQHVTQYLTREGFIGVKPNTLLQTLPLRPNYLVRVGDDYQVVDQAYYGDVPRFLGDLDNVLSQSTLDFQVEDGGPHCLTQEIAITEHE